VILTYTERHFHERVTACEVNEIKVWFKPQTKFEHELNLNISCVMFC
jgi:hypothetical protein